MKIQLSDHFSYSKLIKFTLPTIAMMIFTSIYGVVDGVFVSNCVGSDAFAAVNLIMPIIMILGSVPLYQRHWEKARKKRLTSIFQCLYICVLYQA